MSASSTQLKSIYKLTVLCYALYSQPSHNHCVRTPKEVGSSYYNV